MKEAETVGVSPLSHGSTFSFKLTFSFLHLVWVDFSIFGLVPALC